MTTFDMKELRNELSKHKRADKSCYRTDWFHFVNNWFERGSIFLCRKHERNYDDLIGMNKTQMEILPREIVDFMDNYKKYQNPDSFGCVFGVDYYCDAYGNGRWKVDTDRCSMCTYIRTCQVQEDLFDVSNQ